MSVAGLRPGTTWLTVRATPGAASTWIKITVTPAKVTSISTSVPSVKLVKGARFTVHMKAVPTGVTGVKDAFSGANTKLVRLSVRGSSVTLTGLKPGTTTLTVKAKPGSAQKKIKIVVKAATAR
ncbi:hypothetical protein [Galactobacter valiniphilus]|uniref:hypothetical protein n=1 Tax=Galactobacter valiniphilus TaxID=2676122 RepID=UPI000E67668E|nr:hypothetical protein [Galactobacter valiniphilus]